MNDYAFSARAIHEEKRIFSLCGPLPSEEENDYELLDIFLWQLMEMDHALPGHPIILFLSSPGGSASALWAIVDTFRLLSSPVYTVARYAASAAALLLVCGAKGHRYLFPHATLLLHNVQPSDDCPKYTVWPFTIQSDIQELLTLESNRAIDLLMRECDVKKLLEYLGDWTNVHDPAELKKGVSRFLAQERRFTAPLAIQYGLADRILTQKDMREWHLLATSHKRPRK